MNSFAFVGHSSSHPEGQAASEFLAEQRRVRIATERRSRPAPSRAEQAEARRLRRIGRELDEFMSAASVYTADEEEDMRLFHL